MRPLWESLSQEQRVQLLTVPISSLHEKAAALMEAARQQAAGGYGLSQHVCLLDLFLEAAGCGSVTQFIHTITLSHFFCSLLLLLLKELGDGKLLGVCRCLDLPACAKVAIAAVARVPWAVLVGPPAACQLSLALLPDARAAIRAGDLGGMGP